MRGSHTNREMRNACKFVIGKIRCRRHDNVTMLPYLSYRVKMWTAFSGVTRNERARGKNCVMGPPIYI
jgi:hypothetical protein